MVGFDSLTMKPGDEVILYRNYGEKVVAKIEKITPTGVVRLVGHDITFSQYGSQRGRHTLWPYASIGYVTPEILEEIHRTEAAEKIENLVRRAGLTKNFTAARLQQIVDLLEHPDAHLITFDNSAIADVNTH